MKSIMAIGMLAVAATLAGAAPDGAAIYKEKCAKCHGDKGEGNAKATEKLCKGVTVEQLKLGPIATKSDADVRKITAEGKDKMPAYKEKLSAEEIDAVIAYCRQLVPAKK